jgi:hypothetical protein
MVMEAFAEVGIADGEQGCTTQGVKGDEGGESQNAEPDAQFPRPESGQGADQRREDHQVEIKEPPEHDYPGDLHQDTRVLLLQCTACNSRAADI